MRQPAATARDHGEENGHPGDSPEEIAKVLGTEVDEIARLCADLAAGGLSEPVTRL